MDIKCTRVGPLEWTASRALQIEAAECSRHFNRGERKGIPENGPSSQTFEKERTEERVVCGRIDST